MEKRGIYSEAEDDEEAWNRLAEYKCRPRKPTQEERRFQLLQDQKRRRANALNEARNISEEILDVETTSKHDTLKEKLMFSEWMTKIPEDFDEKWSCLLCPVGKRCLVRSAMGITSVFGKRGYLLTRFRSSLPNGGFREEDDYRYATSEATVLDCIWSQRTGSYFILDLLSWKGQLYMNTETSFRWFWIKSKVEEMPWITVKSGKNPYPFIPLESRRCCVDEIFSLMAKFPYFPSNEPMVDGVLFYHNEAFYTPGNTPLVLWLKPYMVPELLGIEIAEGYLYTKPFRYLNMSHFIEQERDKRRRRRGNRETEAKVEEMSLDPWE